MTTALGIVLAVLFALLGTAKLASVPAMRAAAAHLGYTTDQYRAIGALEMAGALGTVIGMKLAGIGIAAAVGLVLPELSGKLDGFVEAMARRAGRAI